MSGTHTGRGVRGRERGGEGGCGWVLAESERAVLAQQLQLPDALLPSLLPHADRMGTRDPQDMFVRET